MTGFEIRLYTFVQLKLFQIFCSSNPNEEKSHTGRIFFEGLKAEDLWSRERGKSLSTKRQIVLGYASVVEKAEGMEVAKLSKEDRRLVPRVFTLSQSHVRTQDDCQRRQVRCVHMSEEEDDVSATEAGESHVQCMKSGAMGQGNIY